LAFDFDPCCCLNISALYDHCSKLIATGQTRADLNQPAAWVIGWHETSHYQMNALAESGMAVAQ
jgi:hypothetical protein